jgi:hypothetical protein
MFGLLCVAVTNCMFLSGQLVTQPVPEGWQLDPFYPNQVHIGIGARESGETLIAAAGYGPAPLFLYARPCKNHTLGYEYHVWQNHDVRSFGCRKQYRPLTPNERGTLQKHTATLPPSLLERLKFRPERLGKGVRK